MDIPFVKYQGTGNDFVMIDHRAKILIHHNDVGNIELLCDRKFGIGADGLILLEKSDIADFKMVYFNSDGKQSSMCGNGGRCIVAFAASLGLFIDKATFEAIDGLHHATIHNDGLISLQMIDVENIQKLSDFTYELNTGSPHFVEFCAEFPSDIKFAGSAIRYSDKYKDHGINVNFVKSVESLIEVATYERGVEDETLSCGTGVTACALAYAHAQDLLGDQSLAVHTKGGTLSVSLFRNENGSCKNVWLTGPALKVFEGLISI